MTVDRGATEAEALQASNLATKLMAQRDDDEVMVMNDVLASITALRKQFDQVAPGEYSRKEVKDQVAAANAMVRAARRKMRF